MMWVGREVQIFPANKFYHSSNVHRNPWRFHPSSKEGNYLCNICHSGLVDFFSGYQVEKVTYDDDDDDYGKKTKLQNVGLRFFRTCMNCFNGDNSGQIFKSYGNWGFERYIVPIGYTLNDEVPGYLDNADLGGPTLFQRFQVFIDNSDSDLADINEAIIAGFFRSLGIVRDSVDFFVAVGDYIKEKLGIDKEEERELCGSDSKLSQETIGTIKDVSRPSPLEMFRRVFPTGEEIQKASLNAMGIKYEPDTPFKRVLEDLGSSAPFGPTWMAICGAGQVAVESGLIKQNVKPFYEIGLAILAHKAIKLGRNVPSAIEVKEISKSLVEAEIDLSKIRAKNGPEISRACREVDKFLEIRELKPKEIIIPIEEARILPIQATDVCGWKVGGSINNRTILGDVPKWSTVRYRHWKNKALDLRKGISKENLKYELTEENLSRMEKGLAPQFYDTDSKKWVSIELHHEPPQRNGGLFDFIEVTPAEHAGMDRNRNIKKLAEAIKRK